MTILQPGTLEVLLGWFIFAGGTPSVHVDILYLLADPAANPLLHTGPYLTSEASLLPLQANPPPDNLIADLQAAVALPGWVGDAMKWAGLITLVIGLIAYFSSPSRNNRRRGYKMATAGFLLTLVGFAFSTFIGLITYVLSG